MNILFISLQDFGSISEHGLYSDLLREFNKNGHKITIVSPVERRNGKETEVYEKDNVHFIKVRIGNIQKTNYIEKAISTLLLGLQLASAIKKYSKGMAFDLLLYATPPVTIYGVISKVKKITGAKTCLMLKDIWPQEMVDLGLIHKNGFLYKYFKHSEERMYSVSDLIGYTSPANKQYLIDDGVSEVKLIPINNSVDISYIHSTNVTRAEVLQKYRIDESNKVFFYGGNLGKPQDIDFLLSCLKTQVNKKDRFFIICGQGTEYKKIVTFFETKKPNNMKLFPYLPKEEYDQLIIASDVGMIFLNHRFTVPNCPSRFYTYMEYKKPVLACTDVATDIKDVIHTGGFGWWIESNSVSKFEQVVDDVCGESLDTLIEKGNNARKYLEKNYTVNHDYKSIIDSVTLII